MNRRKFLTLIGIGLIAEQTVATIAAELEPYSELKPYWTYGIAPAFRSHPRSVSEFRARRLEMNHELMRMQEDEMMFKLIAGMPS